jgi:protein-disulfide isomerase/uncharacterized membrane protein
MDTIRAYGLFGTAALLLVLSLTVTTGEQAAYAIIPQLAAVLVACAGVIQRDVTYGVLATSAAAFGFNLYLLHEKVNHATGGSLCQVNEVIDCGRINSSPWSMVGTVPVTLLGAGLYAGLVVAATLAPTGEKRTPTLERVVLAYMVPSLLFSVFLGYQSKVIGAVCVFCLSIYVANVLLTWAALRGLRQQSAPPWAAIDRALFAKEGLAVVGVFLAGLLWGYGWYKDATTLPTAPRPTPSQPQAGPAEDDPMAAIAALYAKPAAPVVTDGKEPLLGKADARFQVVEFADFGCPHCAEAEEELKALVEKNPDVSVRFKYFPLTGACNPMLKDPRPGRPEPDPARCHAAYAAECAHQQGKFWEYSHLLFANQRSPDVFGDDSLRFFANQLKLDVPKFEACLAAPETAARITAAAEAGAAAGIQGTPAMFVSGLSDEQLLMTRQVQGLEALMEVVASGTKLPPATPAARTP